MKREKFIFDFFFFFLYSVHLNESIFDLVVCSYQLFQDFNTSILFAYLVIAWKEVIESWHMNMQPWVLYMMYYTVYLLPFFIVDFLVLYNK